jgi:hypothetical protein
MVPTLSYSENNTVNSALETAATAVAYLTLILFFVSLIFHKNIGIETTNAIQLSFASTLLIHNETNTFRALQPLSLTMGITPIF